MSDSTYTEEELERLPQTQQIFDAPEVNLDEHELRQEGYQVTDMCHGVSFGIPAGKTLVKKNGRYSLEDEL